MSKYPISYLVIAFGLAVSILWSYECRVKQGELFRDIAFLCSGTILLLYSLAKNVNTTYDRGQRIRGIIIGIICIIIGFAGILS